MIPMIGAKIGIRTNTTQLRSNKKLMTPRAEISANSI